MVERQRAATGEMAAAALAALLRERFRTDAPIVGHQLSTLEDGAPVSRRSRQSLRADIERPYDQVEEWAFHDSRIFAVVGSFDDDVDPPSGYGWLCRLVDASVLQAGGFTASANRCYRSAATAASTRTLA